MKNSDNKPLVSIIIPAYNAQNYIAETLDSVINQTYSNWEAFVIDDESKDQTISIAKKYISNRLQLIEQKNQGACVARNTGLKSAKGKYIQFLDADDIISLDKLEKQIEILESNPEYLAICPSVHFTHGENYLEMKPREESEWIFDTDDTVEFLIRLYGGYGERWMVQTSAWLTPKIICDKIGNWNEKLLIDQDGEYFARAVLASKGIRTTEGINYYRRFLEGDNVSSKYHKRNNLLSALLALELKASYLKKHKQSQALNRALATLFTEIAIHAYPKNIDIVKQCEQELKNYQSKVILPVMGGQIVELTKYIFGWKAAKRLRLMVHKLRSLK